jgi:hypothetical protein
MAHHLASEGLMTGRVKPLLDRAQIGGWIEQANGRVDRVEFCNEQLLRWRRSGPGLLCSRPRH